MGERGRVPALDGLRGIAVLLVVLHHAGVPGFGSAGGVGVPVFFVLSGYLITGILAREHARTGRIAVGRFYARRALRLFPALAVMLSTCLALFVVLYGVSRRLLVDFGWALTYAQNWRQGDAGSAVHHLWSLAVEEQFYLLWPFALPLVLRSRRPVHLLVGLAAVSCAARLGIAWAWGYEWVMAPTHTNVYGLLLGAAAALTTTRLRMPPDLWLVGVLACGVSAIAEVQVWNGLPAAALTAMLLCSPQRGPMLESRALGWFGHRSYGIYLWHSTLLFPTSDFLRPGLPFYAVTLVTLGVAAASYRWVEQPFLHRKERLADAGDVVTDGRRRDTLRRSRHVRGPEQPKGRIV